MTLTAKIRNHLDQSKVVLASPSTDSPPHRREPQKDEKGFGLQHRSWKFCQSMMLEKGEDPSEINELEGDAMKSKPGQKVIHAMGRIAVSI